VESCVEYTKETVHCIGLAAEYLMSLSTSLLFVSDDEDGEWVDPSAVLTAVNHRYHDNVDVSNPRDFIINTHYTPPPGANSFVGVQL